MMNQPDTLDVPVLDLVPNNEPTTEELIEQEDVAQLVQAKINQLDGIYRNTLLYFYVKQYSLVEIAELMKVSIGTVKSRLFRAKQRLKEMMLQDDTTATAILPA